MSGLTPEARGGEPAARAAEAALDLVEDEDGTMSGGEAARGLEKVGAALVDAAFAEERLEQYGAGVFVDGGLELGEVVAIDKADAGEAGAEVFLISSAGR